MTELLMHSAVCIQCCVRRRRVAEQCHALAQVKLLYNLCEWRLENDMEIREHARRAVGPSVERLPSVWSRGFLHAAQIDRALHVTSTYGEIRALLIAKSELQAHET